MGLRSWQRKKLEVVSSPFNHISILLLASTFTTAEQIRLRFFTQVCAIEWDAVRTLNPRIINRSILQIKFMCIRCTVQCICFLEYFSQKSIGRDLN